VEAVPEVGVRLRVDRLGRVRDVEVRSISPSTEYDEVFRRVVLEELRTWRYAPARLDGEPVEATLEWTIQFLKIPEGRSSGSGVLRGSTISDDALRAAQIFELPPEKQEEALRETASLAERHLDAGKRRRVDSPRFVVITDAPDAETARTVAGNLEAVFGLLDEMLGAGLELQPEHYKMIVYLYWSRTSFAAFRAEVPTSPWAEGFYAPPGLFTFHLETGLVSRVLSALIHESVHAYVDRHVVRPGLRLPTWFSEGLAEYFARSEVRDGRLVPGAVRKGEFVLDRLRGGAYRRKTDTGWTFDLVQRAVRKGEGPTVAELLAMDVESFYGEQRSLHYALSWLLVHFLRHGEPGWSDEEFPALLLYLAEGYPAEAAIETVYERSAEELKERFREHVASL
jgi:hypothetical protein